MHKQPEFTMPFRTLTPLQLLAIHEGRASPSLSLLTGDPPKATQAPTPEQSAASDREPDHAADASF
jgi:hypothetical protein